MNLERKKQDGADGSIRKIFYKKDNLLIEFGEKIEERGNFLKKY
jgi:hypothetical protein